MNLIFLAHHHRGASENVSLQSGTGQSSTSGWPRQILPEISKLVIYHRLSLKAGNCFAGSLGVQVRFLLTLPHARELPHCQQLLGDAAASPDLCSTSFQTGLYSACEQYSLTFWLFQTSIREAENLFGMFQHYRVFKTKIKIRQLLWNNACLQRGIKKWEVKIQVKDNIQARQQNKKPQ